MKCGESRRVTLHITQWCVRNTVPLNALQGEVVCLFRSIPCSFLRGLRAVDLRAQGNASSGLQQCIEELHALEQSVRRAAKANKKDGLPAFENGPWQETLTRFVAAIPIDDEVASWWRGSPGRECLGLLLTLGRVSSCHGLAAYRCGLRAGNVSQAQKI